MFWLWKLGLIPPSFILLLFSNSFLVFVTFISNESVSFVGYCAEEIRREAIILVITTIMQNHSWSGFFQGIFLSSTFLHCKMIYYISFNFLVSLHICLQIFLYILFLLCKVLAKHGRRDMNFSSKNKTSFTISHLWHVESSKLVT